MSNLESDKPRGEAGALNPEQMSVASGGTTWRFYEWKGTSTPVIFLHGFTGTGRDAEALVSHLPQNRRVLSLDLPGHGTPMGTALGMEELVRSLNLVFGELSLRGAHLCGYSMGGRVAMRLALAAPAFFSSVTLLSASPGIENEEERMNRRKWDMEMAEQARGIGGEAFAEVWESLPILAGHDRTPEPWRTRFRMRRRAQSGEGLAQSLEFLGAGNVPSVALVFGACPLPSFLVFGERDIRYRRLLTDLHGRCSRSQLISIPDAGHCLHLEKPSFVASILEESWKSVSGE